MRSNTLWCRHHFLQATVRISRWNLVLYETKPRQNLVITGGLGASSPSLLSSLIMGCATPHQCLLLVRQHATSCMLTVCNPGMLTPSLLQPSGFPTWLISAIADSKLNSEYEGGDRVLRTTVDEVMHLVDRKVLTNALYMAMFVARHNPIGTRPPASFAFFFPFRI